jgi:DtxR family Mn-dependent transcriptional regulator
MTRKARPHRVSASMDRYLHAILLLSDHGQPADTGDVAEKVGVSDAAASRMLRSLEAKGFLRVEPYQGAELTTEGLHRALRVVRRHRLLELYLHQVFQFDLREAHLRATAMQPAIDQVFEDRLDEMLGHPRYDPHGQPIPSKNATWPKVADSPLLDLPPGTSGCVSRVTTDDSEAIAYLKSVGIQPGTPLALESVAPFDGPASVRVGGKALHLGRRLAGAIHVAEDEGAPPPDQPEEQRRSRRRGAGA